MLERVFLVALRAISLVFRFGLTLVLAKFLVRAEAGAFMLYWAAIGLSVSAMGLDVYTKSVRQFLGDSEQTEFTLQRHAGFCVVSLIVFVPISIVVFQCVVPPSHGLLAVFFPVHLVLEYCMQEYGRFLVPLGKRKADAVLLFLRTACWIPLAYFLLEFWPTGNAVEVIVIAWFVGTVLSVGFAVIISAKYVHWKRVTIDLAWVLRSVQASFVMLLGTLFFRSILGFDRFVVEHYLGLEALGVYGVHASIALGVLPLIEAGVSAWRYPTLVKHLKSGLYSEAIDYLKIFVRESVIATLLIVLPLVCLVPWLLSTIGRSEYSVELSDFYAMMVGVFCFGASVPFHYTIYGMGADRCFPVIYSVAAAFLLLFAYCTLPQLGVFGAGVMLAGSLCIIAVLRVLFAVVLLSRRVANDLGKSVCVLGSK